MTRRPPTPRTKPRQAASAATVDRWQIKLMRIHTHLSLAMKMNREMQASLKKAERR